MKLKQIIQHTASAGETFDLLAYKYLGDEKKDYLITEYNDPLAEYLVFEGGETVNIPIYEADVLNDKTLAPWRRVTDD